jgi:GDPmannose 4,6-dehydratase
MKLKALIFGINGQDGYYLNNLLLDNNITVIGVSRSNKKYIQGDVADYTLVQELIRTEQPDYIFHLAANSTTRHDTIFENYTTITTGTLNILEAVYQHSPKSRVFIAGSGLQFVNNNAPITETDEFEARDGYSMARIQSVYTARYYRAKGIKVYIGYFFNHDSPLRSDRHVNQKIALAAKRISINPEEKLSIGDVSVQKEFTYAGDIVNAIWVLINNNDIFETVIGSGKAFPISDWLSLCFSHYGLNWRDHVSIAPGFTPEYRVLVSDPHSLTTLGWQPTVSINELALMMLTHNEEADGQQ